MRRDERKGESEQVLSGVTVMNEWWFHSEWSLLYCLCAVASLCCDVEVHTYAIHCNSNPTVHIHALTTVVLWRLPTPVISPSQARINTFIAILHGVDYWEHTTHSWWRILFPRLIPWLIFLFPDVPLCWTPHPAILRLFCARVCAHAYLHLYTLFPIGVLDISSGIQFKQPCNFPPSTQHTH
jgi:hypothetical protein